MWVDRLLRGTALGLLMVGWVCVGFKPKIAMAQEYRQSKSELFEILQGYLRGHEDDNLRNPISPFSGELMDFVVAEGPITDSMRVFLENIVDDASILPEIRRAGLLGLKQVSAQLEYERVYSHLSDPEVDVQAAGVLVSWGYWDIGSPILIRNEAWDRLLWAGREKAEPILRAATTSGSPKGRMYAAKFLQIYGDSLTQRLIARHILSEYVGAAEAAPDTSNLKLAVETAFEVLSRSPSEPGDAELFRSGLMHPMRSVRMNACWSLMRRASNGDTSAREILRLERDSNPYSDVRERFLNAHIPDAR